MDKIDLNPLGQLQPSWVILATIAVAVITYMALRRVYFGAYLRAMEERQRLLDEGRARLAQAERIANEAGEQAERLIADARQKAEDLAVRFRDEAERYRTGRIAEANKQIDALLHQGREEIDAERQVELAAIRDHALECVGLACERLIGSADGPLIEVTVDKVLKQAH